MNKAGNLIDSISEKLGIIVSYFLILIMSVEVIHVIMRYFFKRPPLWSLDVNKYLFASLIFLGAGYHILHRYIITVDIVYSRFPPKIKAVADLIAFVATFIFCSTVIWKGGEFAWYSIVTREISTSVWGPPVYPLKVILPIGTLLILLQAAAHFIRDIVDVFKNEGVVKGGD